MKKIENTILKKVIHPRKNDSHKGDYGKVLIIGGNESLGGAAILAAKACVYSGCGLLTVATHPTNHAPLHVQLPEAMVIDWTNKDQVMHSIQSSDVILIGCGLGLEKESENLFSLCLSITQEHQWLIIDGSAITLFSKGDFSLPFPSRTIFTPHQKEWERLSKLPIPEQTVENSQKACEKIEAVVVAKSSNTKVYFPDDSPSQLTIGTPAQATGGMGDTLAGILAGFLGQFQED